MQRVVLWLFFSLLLVSVALGFGESGSCTYTPECNEYNMNVCGACERALYLTACQGGCNYSTWGVCKSFLGCPEIGETRTTSEGCPAGQTKKQECSATSCAWTDIGICKVDTSTDADGDGVFGTEDDCPNKFGPTPNNCNGCPNPTCEGCLTWPSACPSYGSRLCTKGNDALCSGYDCPEEGCVGKNWCSYQGNPLCDKNTADCTCPTPTCSPDPRCSVDADNDGVPDANDECPATPPGEVVNFDGCSCSEKDCNDGNECTADSCEAGQCLHPSLPMNTLCTGGSCDGSGRCVGGDVVCEALPGCRELQLPGTHLVAGSCASGECYECNVDLEWNAATESCEGDILWWPDTDGDGHGNPETAAFSSPTRPANHVSNDQDCDDSNSEVNIESDEVCDNIDNNCDGRIDEGSLCGSGSCVAGACSDSCEDVCEPGDIRCNGPWVESCEGTECSRWVSINNCELDEKVCEAGECIVPRICERDSYRCIDDSLEVCEDDWTALRDCQHGCANGRCLQPACDTLCDNRCVNFNDDPDNCGGCNIECGKRETCSEGLCIRDCEITCDDNTACGDNEICHKPDTCQSQCVAIMSVLEESLHEELEMTEEEYEELVEESSDAFEIGIDSSFDGSETTMTVAIQPLQSAKGVRIPLEIPKCMAVHAGELDLGGEYEILRDDPLIVWAFDNLDKPTAIEFSVPKDIDAECRAQVKAMAVAAQLKKPLTPLLVLIIIPILVAVIIFFQRFSPQKEKEPPMSEEEFKGVARQQGMSEELLERHWQEYKKRF